MYSSYFGKIINKANPRAVISENWYSPQSMALTIAASSCGIDSIDMQHGLQTGCHFAYGAWNEKNQNKYELLPSRFWVWGKKDCDNLTYDSNIVRAKDVIIGGNVFLNLWRDENIIPEIFKGFCNKAYALKKNYDIAVLISLDEVVFLNNLSDLLKTAPNNIIWLIRIHPARFYDMPILERIVKDIGVNNIEYVNASSLPLYALLKISDVHITWFSTCALEALAFNVKTILVAEDGIETFNHFITNGDMYYTSKTDEILELIRISKEDKIRRSYCDYFADYNATKTTIESLCMPKETTACAAYRQ